MSDVKLRQSDEYDSGTRGNWINRERVLIFGSCGISASVRHLIKDLRGMLPHSKSEPKMERKDPLVNINEICEMKHCNKCIFFESRKKKDVYMWVSQVPDGPSAKFFVQNIHTQKELKMTGNSLKGSRPLISFSKTFDRAPHLKVVRELFTQTFGTPRNHPLSQPFIDHVFNFGWHDRRVWFRNFQIADEDGSLVEIGPRFTLELIKVFEKSFSGNVLFENANFVSPNLQRSLLRKLKSGRYKSLQTVKAVKDQLKCEAANDPTLAIDDTDALFGDSDLSDDEEERPPSRKRQKKN